MSKKGFTLVELLVVLLLLSLLTVLVVSNVSTPLESYNNAISSAKLNIILTAAKNYAEDNINSFAECTFNADISSSRTCLINPRDLVDGGYLEEDDVVNLDSDYAIVACYNSDNTTISTFYKDISHITCNDLEVHRLTLDPQMATVYYQDTLTLTSSISTAGNFQSLHCEVSPDNQTWTSWASCSISSDYKVLSIQFYGRPIFPYVSSQIMTVKVFGNYIDDKENEQVITNNFRIVIFR